ncbi:MAG: 16S rRNA (uracil(1498)-N(3))-methyltransferase [Flavobacteriales bacterium]|nr:16S rRNA (uracil(1498)-N(3))-methyltransferase [Flavobacteriales bacterium]
MDFYFGQKNDEGGIELSEEESRHCLKVKRVLPGDPIYVVDGEGGWYSGIVETDKKRKQVRVRVDQQGFFPFEDCSSGFNLFIASTKSSERMEWMTEKLIELGVDSIHFIECEHSERNHLRFDRLRKIAISALKQSKQYWLPKIHAEISFDTLVNNYDKEQMPFYIAHCSDLERAEFENRNPEKEISVLIGPEGDFSRKEIGKAIAKGMIPVSLGVSRLRTETAAIYSCSVHRSRKNGNFK